MAVNVIETGKYKVETVGPMKNIPNKQDPNKPWKSWSLQFAGDAAWYDTFWVRDSIPVVDEELEGSKQEDDKFGLQFKMAFAKGGNKANWNPAASNAAVMGVAAQVVHDFLSLKPEHLAAWEKKRKPDQTPESHYLQTIIAIAGSLKQEVIKMGGTEVQTSSKTSVPPPDDGDPGPVSPGIEGWADDQGGEQHVDLGPM